MGWGRRGGGSRGGMSSLFEMRWDGGKRWSGELCGIGLGILV